METTISEAHFACVSIFSVLLETLQKLNHQPSLDSTRDVFDKYRLWSCNVGAGHSGRSYRMSLDYRLREASFYRLQVLKLLHDLQDNLTKALKHATDTRIPADYDAAGDSESSSSGDLDAEDSPWEVSSDSEMEEANTHAPRNAPLSSSVSGPKATKPESVPLESIDFLVTCLWKLPIRRPAPMDRLKKKTATDMSSYLPFDLMHIKEKFPSVDETVAARLAKMISRRRQIIRYRKDHTDALQEKETVLEAKISISGELPSKNVDVVNEVAPSVRTSSQGTAVTKATTLRPTAPVALMPTSGLYAPFITESQGSSVMSEQTAKDTPIKIPYRPRNAKGDFLQYFTCPYCSIAQNIISERQWKRHVLSDLQPYTCTYPKCHLHEYFFETIQDWFDHESRTHRLEWFCNTESHPSFSDVSDFQEHMKVVHNELVSQILTSNLQRGFQYPSRAKSGICMLCGKQAKLLRSHVARHLEQLALFAIPQTDYMADWNESDALSNIARRSIATSGPKSASDQSEESISSTATSVQEVLSQEDTNHQTLDYENDENLVPDVAYRSEEGIDTSWDSITTKFQEARAGMHSDREDLLEIEESRPIFTGLASPPVRTFEADAVQTTLKPVGLPIVKVTPPDADQHAATQAPPKPRPAPRPRSSSASSQKPRLSLLQRARRYSLKLTGLPSSSPPSSSSPSLQLAAADADRLMSEAPSDMSEDLTLHPFWRPRGFWDGFDDSESDSDTDELPAGGDTSNVDLTSAAAGFAVNDSRRSGIIAQLGKKSWRDRLRSLTKKTGWDQERREALRRSIGSRYLVE